MTVAQWDALPESEQDWWLARKRRDALRHSCGHSRDVCGDPEREWFEQLEVCYVTRQQQAAWAAFERLHEKKPWHNGDMTSWAEKQSESHPYRWDHGVTIWAAEVDYGRGGNFTTQTNPKATAGPS